MVRRTIIFGLLLALKGATRIFYRYKMPWVGEVPPSPWKQEYRVVAILNHTSLFEWLFVGGLPVSFLWRIATHALVPAAQETLRRPIVGRFFKLLAPQMVPISRQPDQTWKDLMERVDPEGMVIILPEGRMKRADGTDKHGRPMTVRGGIADILEAVPKGRMLLAYSGGLHHVQVPGQILPKPFKTLTMALESIDIPKYKETVPRSYELASFKESVKADLENRRDTHCPIGRELWVA